MHKHNLLNCVQRTRLTLQQELGRTPSDEEMTAQSQISPQKYIKMLRLTKHATSLGKPKYQNNPKGILDKKVKGFWEIPLMLPILKIRLVFQTNSFITSILNSLYIGIISHSPFDAINSHFPFLVLYYYSNFRF